MKIPAYVTEQFGGQRAFKANKRAVLKQAIAAIDELRRGCVWFPDKGVLDVSEANKALDRLNLKLSAKKWGR